MKLDELKHEPKKRYKTIKPPEGFKIIKQQYLGELAGNVKSIRIFFEEV